MRPSQDSGIVELMLQKLQHSLIPIAGNGHYFTFTPLYLFYMQKSPLAGPKNAWKRLPKAGRRSKIYKKTLNIWESQLETCCWPLCYAIWWNVELLWGLSNCPWMKRTHIADAMVETLENGVPCQGRHTIPPTTSSSLRLSNYLFKTVNRT